MKHVLILMPSLKMGGAEKSLISLLNQLTPQIQQENNITVDLMLVNRNGELTSQIPSYINQVPAPRDFQMYITQLKEAIKIKNINVLGFMQKMLWAVMKKVHPSKKTLSENELYWYCIGKKLKSYPKKYDVAIAYMNGTATYYLIDKIKADRKVVWVHNELSKLNVNMDFQNQFFIQADGIVTISELCKDSIISCCPEVTEKVHVIENISDYSTIATQADEFYPEEYKALSEDTHIILSIGRLVYQKGFDIGIQAASLLKKNGIKFIWFIMGNGELHDELSMQIENAGLTDEVKLMGIRDNPYPYIKNSEIIFQPSRFEGKSIVLDEAKLLLKTIVAANYGTVGCSLQNHVNGIICELEPSALAYGLEDAVNNTELNAILKKNLDIELSQRKDILSDYLSIIDADEKK